MSCFGWVFLYMASSQQGDLTLSGPLSSQGTDSRLEPATEGPLQISGRIHYPLCHRRRHSDGTPFSIFMSVLEDTLGIFDEQSWKSLMSSHAR
ncbi:hypothetical protein PoB_006669000 [Plakobranchus ocellatus]|uniref:Uncharacterized protein n=1 Tax=Plakobranchus ocellatus TaxID=259542 RepID=A0AAV4D869_9GAST|nr:hypothetical protein PoB_006669000 [Plakobranchus ocellatus]